MMTGLEIRDFMEANDWKQERLAAALGVTQSTVSRWLKGAVPGPRYQEEIKKLFSQYGMLHETQPAQGKPQAQSAGDVPLTAEAAALLTEMVDKFLGAYHPLALRLWREATARAVPFPADIALSPEERDRLLKEAELQGHRARIRSNRQTD